MENSTRKNARGHRSGVMEPTQKCLFIVGLKRADEGTYHEGHTQKVCNPSRIATTILQGSIVLGVDDYRNVAF